MENQQIRMIDERTVEVSLPNKIGYERIAMACSASFAKIVGLMPERIEDLKTAVSEACLNAIEHGNNGRPEARVIVTMNYHDHSFIVSVMDEGVGIKDIPEDPDIIKKMERLEPPRGLGIFLIKNLADQVDLNQVTEDGHIIRIVIRMEV